MDSRTEGGLKGPRGVVGLLQGRYAVASSSGGGGGGRTRLPGWTPVGPERQLNIRLMCFPIQKIGHFGRLGALAGSLLRPRYAELIEFALLHARRSRSRPDREFINRISCRERR